MSYLAKRYTRMLRCESFPGRFRGGRTRLVENRHGDFRAVGKLLGAKWFFGGGVRGFPDLYHVFRYKLYASVLIRSIGIRDVPFRPNVLRGLQCVRISHVFRGGGREVGSCYGGQKDSARMKFPMRW